MVNVNVYKVHPKVELPKFQTEESACFDLAYDPSGKYSYVYYDSSNTKMTRSYQTSDKMLTINPKNRAMVPTGLQFSIPKGFCMKIYARSGLSLKKGLGLINSVGVVDSDFIDEVYLLMVNNSTLTQTIKPGDRIAQAEIVPVSEVQFVELNSPPTQKTDRVGGFGSTG